jgi:hypothetical protein
MTVQVFAPELFEPRLPYGNRKRDAFLRDNASVDPEILALELNVSAGFVRMLQRKIGVRKCTCTPRKADCLREKTGWRK